ncbi:MAG: hypothetical protein WD294_01265 [Phycisphaeraceae bacterium]
MDVKRFNGTTWLALLMVLALGWAGANQFGTGQAEAQQGPPDDRPMGGMMDDMSPKMMELMQRAHAGDDSAWHVSEEGIFVVRGTHVLRYDAESLDLVGEAELPEELSPAFAIEREDQEQAEDEQAPQGRRQMRMQRMEQMEQMRQRMHQMMTQAQASLPTDIHVVDDAVFVTRGTALLRYDLELNLQEAAELPGLMMDDEAEQAPAEEE